MKLDIDAFNKKRAAAFNQHKNIVKKLSKGQTLLCEQCNTPLQLDLKGQDKSKGQVSCAKGCTSIELELG